MKTKVIKALLIDPHLREIREVEFTDSLDEIYRLTHCRMIEAVYSVSLHPNDVIYVDEEGLLGDLSKQAFFAIAGNEQPGYAGYGLVVGTTTMGNNASAKSTLGLLKEAITWPTLEELRDNL